jgi:beta-galactosidase
LLGGVLVSPYLVATTASPVAVKLTPHRSTLRADGQDVTAVTVEVVDAEGRPIPTASQEITFAITGAGNICGVGNGDPSSHEPDQFLDSWSAIDVNWKYKAAVATDQPLVVGADYDDSDWIEFASHPLRSDSNSERRESTGSVRVHRGTFERPQLANTAEVRLLFRGHSQALVYFNDKLCELETRRDDDERVANLEVGSFRDGRNVIAVVIEEAHLQRDHVDREVPAVVKVRTPAQHWKRKLFNGLAQVIVRSTAERGELMLVATVPGLEQAKLNVRTKP